MILEIGRRKVIGEFCTEEYPFEKYGKLNVSLGGHGEFDIRVEACVTVSGIEYWGTVAKAPYGYKNFFPLAEGETYFPFGTEGVRAAYYDKIRVRIRGDGEVEMSIYIPEAVEDELDS